MLPDIGFDVYPIMMVLGLGMCFVYLEIYLRKIKTDRSLITSIELAGTISALIGVITSILFQNLYDFIENPSEYKWTWAMTFFGGLLGGVLAFLIQYFFFMKKKHGPFMKTLLVVVGPCIAIAHGIGRIGCFLDGCCYGVPTDSIFGIKFTTTATKVWPTNLFEAIFLITLSIVLLLLAIKTHSDYIFPSYMISYGIFRFLIEYLRGDHRGSFIPGISPSQFWAIVLFVIGIVYIVILIVLKKKKAVKN